MSCGVCHRHGSDPAGLCLWLRPVAVALIRTLAWKLTYAGGGGPKKKGKKKRERETDEQDSAMQTGRCSLRGSRSTRVASLRLSGTEFQKEEVIHCDRCCQWSSRTDI